MLEIIRGDALEVLKTLPARSVQVCVTSPPYWGLRDYGVNGQLGLEPTPEQWTSNMVAVFAEVKRVLRDDGTLWVNMGDCYATGGNQMSGYSNPNWIKTGGACNGGPVIKTGKSGLKPKDLVGQPWRLTFALQADGWYLRSDIIWHKPNPMPESVTDRPTKSHEYIFLLSKSERYYYNAEAIREPHAEPWRGKGEKEKNNWSVNCARGSRESIRQYNPSGRNKRTVWTIATQPYKGAHFATFPEALPRTCILAGSKPGDIVLDPFAGSGTTGKVALELGRGAQLIELNPDYVELIKRRTNVTASLL